MKSCFEVRATLVADEFIDRYMPEANGEYVKVYLYLLRHKERQVSVLELADALNRTESDIRRALTYWERQGVLAPEDGRAESAGPDGARAGKTDETITEKTAERPVRSLAPKAAKSGTEEDASGRKAAAETAAAVSEPDEGSRGGSGQSGTAESAQAGGGLPDARIPAQRESYTPEQVKKLSEDEEFTQLRYVAQKYLNKVFTPRDCEVFAYLYDGLRLPAELLEYLVEYCVQGGHDSIRYLETVGLNWHEKGINTVERAKQHTASYSNEAFAVMRAFGLSDRRPGSSEMEMIHRWFREWGFSKDMVLEACARTLAATNKPSFAYADRILMEWKKANARTMEDVRKLDGEREKARSAETAGRSSRSAQQAPAAAGKRNRFHNFEQRDTDYDAIVLRQLKERLGKQ